MNIKPVRLQRRRTKGFRLESPNGLPIVYVGRPTIYGNPFSRYLVDDDDRRVAVKMFRDWWEGRGRIHGQLMFEDQFELIMRAMFQTEPHPLRGNNVSCWCPLDKDCHGDVWLEIAN